MKPTRVLVSSVLIAAALGLACPYKLAREGSVALPGGVKSLAIPLARNLTLEAGLDDLFTRELIKRFRADGRVAMLAPGEAEAELRCTLLTLTISPVSYGGQGRVTAEAAGLEAECRLVIPAAESVIWTSGRLTAAEEYPVGDDYLRNEDLKAQAISEVCLDLSESVRSRLLDSF